MPIPSAVCRCSIQGTVQGSEIFDTSFWTLGGTADQADTQALATGIADVLTATDAMSNTLAAIRAADEYVKVRVYAYPDGGQQAAWIAEAPIELLGTGAESNPLQTCMVVSLRTSLSGRSHRGRMYLPARGQVITPTGQISETDTTGLASEWAAILGQVNGIALPGGGNPSVSVVSQTLTNSTVVTSVIVDSVPDIQRRRSNKLVASTRSQIDLT